MITITDKIFKKKLKNLDW